MDTKKKWILIGEERFYYEEIELLHGRKKIDLDIAKENLQLFYSIIETGKITYGIIFGTLLGAIRENNFIAHDEDTDIYILEEEKEIFFNLLALFQKQGLQLVRFEPDMLTLMRNNEYIDVYFFKLKYKFGTRRVRVFENNYEYPAENLENPVRYMFLGMNIFVPDNPREILKKIFGSNWETPVINSPSRPNTIHNKLSGFAKGLRKLPFYRNLEFVVKKFLTRAGF